MLDTEGVNALVLMRSRMKNKKKFFSCDGANKGIHHVVKMVSFWWNHQVTTFLIDSDAAVGDDSNSAMSADKSLEKIDSITEDQSRGKN